MAEISQLSENERIMMASDLRIVKSMFCEWQDLVGAFVELFSMGFTADVVCILGTREAMSYLSSLAHAGNGIDDQILRLIRDNTLFIHQKSGREVVASPGALSLALSRIYFQQERTSGPPISDDGTLQMLPLSDLFDDGCWELIVAANQPRQHSQATRTLLHHSSRDVQTNEFRLL